jgi:inosine-uridine nucleoside N-ribohydrolase
MPVVIDTDMLQDDWLAILYLASEPTVDLRAVTITGTTALRCDAAVDSARRLLVAAGKPDVPVACGRPTPLQGDHAFPVEWGANALLAFEKLGLPAVTPRPEASSGAETLLADAIRAADGPVTLVTLGPLTDVAVAFDADPSLPGRLDRIVMMGGAVGVAGNVAPSPTAEWNIYVDPSAADAVFRSGAPVTLVALDATDRVPLTVAFIDRLAADHATAAATVAAGILDGYRDFAAAGGAFIWDPLAAAIAREPRLALTRPIEVAVVQDGPESGRTIEAHGTGAAVLLATDANGPSFESLFIDVLNGRLP